MDQPARATVYQREGCRHEGVVGGFQAHLLREGQSQDHPRLGIIGEALTRGAVDQQIEIGKPAKGLAGDGDGEPRGSDLMAAGLQEMLLGDNDPAGVAEDVQKGVAQWFKPGA